MHRYAAALAVLLSCASCHRETSSQSGENVARVVTSPLHTYFNVALSACWLPGADRGNGAVSGAAVGSNCADRFELMADRIVVSGTGSPVVHIAFDDTNGARVASFTSRHIGDILVLAHDGRVVTAARIVEPTARDLQAEGMSTEDLEAIETVLASDGTKSG